MIRSDIPDRVAMMISGYKTRLIFKRYNTIDDTDLKLVAQRQAPDLDSQMGEVAGKVINLVEKKS